MVNNSPLIVALDYADAAPALALAERLRGSGCRLKIGKELFTRAGPALVAKLQEQGFEIFLDLKFHDIPNTVAQACKVAAALGVWMVNVHALGGKAMLQAARDALEDISPRPRLIAVTVLTSLDTADLVEIGLSGSPADNVLRLARLAQAGGADGVVCSPLEISRLRVELGPQFELVTPGIRPAGSARNDQKRVMTPAQAIQAGATYLVVGRPITAAPDPLVALQEIQAEILATS